MDRFEDLRAFVQAVESGSLTRAAEALQVATSAVSRRIKELEGRLGTQLLQRTTRQMRLTAAGETFHARAVEILQALEEAETEAGCQSRTLTGPLRIAAPLSFGHVASGAHPRRLRRGASGARARRRLLRPDRRSRRRGPRSGRAHRQPARLDADRAQAARRAHGRSPRRRSSGSATACRQRPRELGAPAGALLHRLRAHRRLALCRPAGRGRHGQHARGHALDQWRLPARCRDCRARRRPAAELHPARRGARRAAGAGARRTPLADRRASTSSTRRPVTSRRGPAPSSTRCAPGLGTRPDWEDFLDEPAPQAAAAAS